MKTHTNKRRRVTLYIAYGIIVAFCLFFYFAITHGYEVLIREKFIDRQFEVDLIADKIDTMVDAKDDWDTYDYVELLTSIIERIDATGGTYAEIMDAGLNTVSARHPLRGVLFRPLEHPAVVEAISNNERGELTVRFDGPGVRPLRPHDLNLYYRWIPTDASLNHRLLVIIGVSQYSIDTTFSVWITWGAAALLLITSFYMIQSSMLYYRLSERE